MEQNRIHPVIPPVIINVVDDDDDDERNENNREVEAPEEVEIDEEAVVAEQQQQQALAVAAEMREASVSCYLPGILQINYVINDSQTIAGALTTAGDHDTPCHHCQD